MKSLERFKKKYTINEKGCWVWKGSLDGSGRGKFLINGKQESSQRASWMIHKGNIPKGKIISTAKTCNNNSCVNPDHIYMICPKENIKDQYEIKFYNRWIKKAPYCDNGHAYTKQSLYIDSKGSRSCKICKEKR